MKAITKRKPSLSFASFFQTTYPMISLTVLMRNGRSRWRLRHALPNLCDY